MEPFIVGILVLTLGIGVLDQFVLPLGRAAESPSPMIAIAAAGVVAGTRDE